MGGWAFISLTKSGLERCKKVCSVLEVDGDILTISKREASFVDRSFDKFHELMQYAFKSYDTILCVMATGIVVRSISSLLESKTTDPAILVMDEAGEYCISLLSGHIGGGNDMARLVESKLDAKAVITTASDVKGKLAVDTLAQRLNLTIDDMKAAKDITAMIVNGDNIMVCGETVDNLPEYLVEDELSNQDKYDGLIVISNNNIVGIEKPYVQLVPRSIVIGIGCRRGVSYDSIKRNVMLVLNELGISIKSVGKIATVDIKRDEVGIIELADDFNTELVINERIMIAEVESLFGCSEFVRKTIGVGCVAEPCGYLASNKGNKLCEIKKIDGMTISIWEDKSWGNYTL